MKAWGSSARATNRNSNDARNAEKHQPSRGLYVNNSTRRERTGRDEITSFEMTVEAKIVKQHKRRGDGKGYAALKLQRPY
jgi:hypothetical protein